MRCRNITLAVREFGAWESQGMITDEDLSEGGSGN